MLRRTVLAFTIAVSLGAGPAFAEQPGGVPPSCSPSVAAALNAWDATLTAAASFGERAVTVAREKGRDLLLPLLGIDPATEQGQAADPLADVWRALEASRTDPAKREALCRALTQASDAAKDRAKAAAGAGIDALKKALEGIRPASPPPATPNDGLTRT